MLLWLLSVILVSSAVVAALDPLTLLCNALWSADFSKIHPVVQIDYRYICSIGDDVRIATEGSKRVTTLQRQHVCGQADAWERQSYRTARACARHSVRWKFRATSLPIVRGSWAVGRMTHIKRITMRGTVAFAHAGNWCEGL